MKVSVGLSLEFSLDSVRASRWQIVCMSCGVAARKKVSCDKVLLTEGAMNIDK